MAKKDAASKRLIRLKTTADYLARLPQFEPRPIPFADLDLIECTQCSALRLGGQACPACGFQPRIDDVEGKQRIDDVLSKFMASYISDATKLQSFLNDAKRAIAGMLVCGRLNMTAGKQKSCCQPRRLPLRQQNESCKRWINGLSYRVT